MKRVVLKADEGMIYTNGTDYALIIFLAVGLDGKEWYQIPIEEYEAIEKDGE